MVLHLPAVSEHGRQVLVAVGHGSCLVALVSTTLLRVTPPPPPTVSVMEHLLPSAVYPPVVAMQCMLKGWRPCLHVLAAISDISVVVVAAVLTVAGVGPAGRHLRTYLMAAGHVAKRAQILIMIVCLILWVMVTSWAGHLTLEEATQQWNAFFSSYDDDPAAHLAVEDIQFFLGCCGPDDSQDFREWVRLRNGTVPPSCCRPENEVPCLFDDMFAYEADAGSDAEKLAVWRRVLPRVLHVKACPHRAFRWVRSRTQQLLIVLLMTAAQHVLLAGLALSALHNSCLNRDPLAPGPATALGHRYRHPLAMTQL